MRQDNNHLRLHLFRPLVSGLLGMTLLMPASFFMLTIVARMSLGSRSLYYYFAPSFLQSPFDLFALHKAQCIVGGVLVAVLCNGLALLDWRIERGKWGWMIGVQYRRHSHWLNAAIALQGLLLLLVLIAYTIIQHARY